jgi:hypothetical protein
MLQVPGVPDYCDVIGFKEVEPGEWYMDVDGHPIQWSSSLPGGFCALVVRLKKDRPANVVEMTRWLSLSFDPDDSEPVLGVFSHQPSHEQIAYYKLLDIQRHTFLFEGVKPKEG